MVQFASTDSTAAQNADMRRAEQAKLESMGEEIATLAAHIHAATYRLLVLLCEFDEREGWAAPGFRSCAHWLSWRTGIASGAAREKVRTARALRSLPRIGEAMRKGELSFAKVRAITRVATPENETALLDVARSGTAAQVERIVRAWRRVDRLEEAHADQQRHESRSLSLYIDDDGMYVVRGRLDPEAGALLEKALESAREELFGRSAVDPSINDSDAAQRRADALELVAERSLLYGDAGQRRRFVEVVVHVDAAALRQDSNTGQAVIEGGARVSAETPRRISCDTARVFMMHDQRGSTMDAGPRTRTVPPAIRRALEHRDRHCRFPGCELRYCDAHHITHWADGGRTRLDNLVLLCRRHHRAVHEYGFRVERAPDGVVRFLRPDGRPLPDVPAISRPPADLVDMHTARGISVDTSALISFSTGQPLDLEHAVRTLRCHLP